MAEYILKDIIINMKKYTFEEDLKKRLKDPVFKKAWEESEAEYQVSRMLIAARLKRNMSQKDLAKKANTTQAVISRLENMNANPSIGLIQKIANALNFKVKLLFE